MIIRQTPGAVCPYPTKFNRFIVYNPAPSIFVGRDANVTNEFGTTTVPYRVKRLSETGIMGILPTGYTYLFEFDDSAAVISSLGLFRSFLRIFNR